MQAHDVAGARNRESSGGAREPDVRPPAAPPGGGPGHEPPGWHCSPRFVFQEEVALFTSHSGWFCDPEEVMCWESIRVFPLARGTQERCPPAAPAGFFGDIWRSSPARHPVVKEQHSHQHSLTASSPLGPSTGGSLSSVSSLYTVRNPIF